MEPDSMEPGHFQSVMVWSSMSTTKKICFLKRLINVTIRISYILISYIVDNEFTFQLDIAPPHSEIYNRMVQEEEDTCF